MEKMEVNYPNYILTDVTGDIDFFEPYMIQMEWTDINKLYDGYDEYAQSMTERKPALQFIKHISEYDLKLKKFIVGIFKQLGIRTSDFRCDFFLTKPGGYLPPHVDHMSKISILLPLTPNTGLLKVGDSEIVYQNMLVLNTQIEHEVQTPTQDRLLFRIAVHDFYFDDLKVVQEMNND